MASMKQIANELQLSRTLVCKVLNGRLGTSGASPRTIAAIQLRAQELGYRKNLTAAALTARRHNVLGVLLHSHGVPGSGIVENLLMGICQEAHHAGQRLMLDFFGCTEEFHELAQQMHHSSVDGVLLAGVPDYIVPADIRALMARQIPVITLRDTNRALPDCLNVGLDQSRITFLATRHLLDQGCRNIAHIRIFGKNIEDYRPGLAQAGLPCAPQLLFRAADFSYESGRRAAETWLRSGQAFDGVVAQSDHQATGVLQVLRAAGRRVPVDVKIIGVDDSPLCTVSEVPLSSISQNSAARGAAAVRLLLARLRGEPVHSITVEPCLVARQSTATAKPCRHAAPRGASPSRGSVTGTSFSRKGRS